MSPSRPDISRTRDAVYRLEAALFEAFVRNSAAASEERRWKRAELLTVLAHDILGIRKTYVRNALQERLGYPPAKARQVGREVYRNFFRNALENASTLHATPGEIASWVEVEGREHVEAAWQAQRGAVLITAHYGQWELMPHWLVHQGYQITSVVRRQSNQHIDALFDRIRTVHGARVTDSGYGLRDILRTIRDGHFLGLLSDQNAGDRGLFVRFFGRLASTVVGPAAIAQKTGCPLIALVTHPNPRRPHRIEILPPLWPDRFPPGQDGLLALTQAYTDLLAAWIARRPEQWFWLHRRWKTRPPGEIEEKHP